jgi:hypothetical protein
MEGGLKEPKIFSKQEINGAIATKKLHDAIEISAYNGLVEKIISLGITTDEITEKDSRTLLRYIMCCAHKTMRASGGYIDARTKHLNMEKQLLPLMVHLDWIVYDRDRRLTNAKYISLSELIFNLDDHNIKVKQLLLDIWGHPNPDAIQGLENVKQQIKFYERLNRVLSFDLKENLTNIKNNHSSIREIFPSVEIDDEQRWVKFYGIKNESFKINFNSLNLSAFSLMLNYELKKFIRSVHENEQNISVKKFIDTYYPEIIFK